jgi:GNAT superfamily N-acetyltransferase
LFDQYRQFYKQPSDLEAATAFLAERLSKSESIVFLAEEGSHFVGFAQLYPSWSSVSMKRAWILNDLFVAPAFRGKGVGKALLAGSVQFGKETGAVGLTLKTAVDNKTAQRLYDSCGWVPETKFMSYKFTF